LYLLVEFQLLPEDGEYAGVGVCFDVFLEVLYWPTSWSICRLEAPLSACPQALDLYGFSWFYIVQFMYTRR
jgi:hypothetical protein